MQWKSNLQQITELFLLENVKSIPGLADVAVKKHLVANFLYILLLVLY